jgi:DNA-3-methyladenine glycosylase II
VHWAILERITDDSYFRALRLLGHDALLAVHSVGTPARPRLVLRVTADAVDDALLAVAAEQIRRTFALGIDPAPFLLLAERDPAMWQAAQAAATFRPIITAVPYEALLWAIVGQQINITFASTLKRTLLELAGGTLEVAGQSYPLLPEPAAVALLEPTELRAHKFSGQKTAYVLGVSAAIERGELDFTHLATLPAEDAITTMTQHKGIGRWTAEYVLMRGLGTMDAMPAGDLGLRAVIGRAYGLGRHATEVEVREHADAWAGWRGWASFYWWRHLQLHHD